MTAQVQSSYISGFEAIQIIIEVDTSNSLPGTTIVGLGNKSVDEAKERIKSALANSKLQMPRKRITINLAPADIPKDGSSFDLAMALAILLKSQQVPPHCLAATSVVGELGLDGSVRPVPGIIGHAQAAKAHKRKRIIVPIDNAPQASLVKGIEVIAVGSLEQLFHHLIGDSPIAPHTSPATPAASQYAVRLRDITGQPVAKRALTIAAAGHHNVLLTGPPGTGKSMLAQSLISLLPPLSQKEMVSTLYLHSLSSHRHTRIDSSRPFRAPHHSASYAALVGGGAKPMPGEISLAHNGVLFLDELPEFNRNALEALRQPLEQGLITVTRAQRSATYPASCIMIAAHNPCPCGYFGDDTHECTCTLQRVLSYQAKISGPLLDRIDLSTHIGRVDHKKLLFGATPDDTTHQKKVLIARKRQLHRQGMLNGQMTTSDMRRNLSLSPAALRTLNNAASTFSLSARGYLRCVKVAQTIADLEEYERIDTQHIHEALQYRHARQAQAQAGQTAAGRPQTPGR